MPKLKVYEVEESGATVHVITTNKDKADAIASEILDGPRTVSILPMDFKLHIWLDRDGKPSDGGTLTERTCAEWISSQGEGLLCTSEF